MSDAALTFAYRVVGEDGLDAVQPLWEKLRTHHSPLLSRFPGETPPFAFGPRKQEMLAKAAAGKIRIELVSISPDAADVAYCVSTVSAGGRGEVDSMFVEERFRGRGVGAELIRHALAWIDSTGASSKVVAVAYANEEALEFYKRFGFHPRSILLQQPKAAYELRPATESEKDRIFESYRITVGPYVTETWGWDESFQTAKFWKHHPLRNFKIIQLEQGFGGGLYVEEDKYDLYIRMIFLLPEFQGLGIGSRLITDIHNLAGARGKGLRLTVIRCNPARKLYDRLGFTVTGEDDSSYDMRWA